MEQRISLITLGVADTARSRAFYEALGWKAAFENEEVVFFQLNGIVLGLFRRDSFDLDMKRDNDGTGRIALAYNVRDRSEVDPALDRAVAAGGSVLKRAEETLGRIFRLFRRSGWARLGSRAQSGLDNHRGRPCRDARLTACPARDGGHQFRRTEPASPAVLTCVHCRGSSGRHAGARRSGGALPSHRR